MKTFPSILAILFVAVLVLSQPLTARADDGELGADEEYALAESLGFFSVAAAKQTYYEILVLSDAYDEGQYDDEIVLGVCAENTDVLQGGLERLKQIAKLEAFKGVLEPIIALYDAVTKTNDALIAFVKAETEEESTVAAAAFKAAKGEVAEALDAIASE